MIRMITSDMDGTLLAGSDWANRRLPHDFAGTLDYRILNLDYSPIKGPEGNIEYLLYLGKGEDPAFPETAVDVDLTVERAHEAL